MFRFMWHQIPYHGERHRQYFGNIIMLSNAQWDVNHIINNHPWRNPASLQYNSLQYWYGRCSYTEFNNKIESFRILAINDYGLYQISLYLYDCWTAPMDIGVMGSPATTRKSLKNLKRSPRIWPCKVVRRENASNATCESTNGPNMSEEAYNGVARYKRPNTVWRGPTTNEHTYLHLGCIELLFFPYLSKRINIVSAAWGPQMHSAYGQSVRLFVGYNDIHTWVRLSKFGFGSILFRIETMGFALILTLTY